MTEEIRDRFNEIKQQFMLMKNGVVSDSMKAAGSPHRIIWGLNMPQLREIAQRFDLSGDLFDALWHDTSTRESVIIAPMLLPYDELSVDDAITLIDEAPTLEAIDSLTFNALRHRRDVWDIIAALDGSDAINRRYAAMRLLARVIRENLQGAKALAEREAGRKDARTYTAADNILGDIEFLSSGDASL